VRARPLPSAEVLLSSTCVRYCGPLRLPDQPPATSGSALIRRGWPPVGHWPGSPVVPSGAVRACRPCYPGGPQVPWQQYWAPGRRSSPSGNGVDALTELTRLHLGSLHATACAVAHVGSDALVRELGALGYPSHLPQATRARCPLPGPDFHRQVREYPRHATGHQLGRKPSILRGHPCKFRLLWSAAERRSHEGRTSDGALIRPRGWRMSARGSSSGASKVLYCRWPTAAQGLSAR
jgi:hypothetical protein